MPGEKIRTDGSEKSEKERIERMNGCKICVDMETVFASAGQYTTAPSRDPQSAPNTNKVSPHTSSFNARNAHSLAF